MITKFKINDGQYLRSIEPGAQLLIMIIVIIIIVIMIIIIIITRKALRSQTSAYAFFIFLTTNGMDC